MGKPAGRIIDEGTHYTIMLEPRDGHPTLERTATHDGPELVEALERIGRHLDSQFYDELDQILEAGGYEVFYGEDDEDEDEDEEPDYLFAEEEEADDSDNASDGFPAAEEEPRIEVVFDDEVTEDDDEDEEAVN